jgi:hypothetical protein
MAEPNSLQEVHVVVPVAAIVPPVPRTIEEILIGCGFTVLPVDIAVDQGLETLLSIALMIPDQIDRHH